MKVLYWHADYLKYKATSRALKSAPEIEKEEDSINESIIVLIAFEKEDNESVLDKLAYDLIEYSKKIKADRVMIYPYAHLSKNLLNPSESLKLLEKLRENKALKNHFKEIKFSPFGWYKSFEVKIKGHPLAELSRSF